MRNNWFVFVFVYCCCCSIYRYKLKITFSPRFLLLLAKQLIAYAYSLIPKLVVLSTIVIETKKLTVIATLKLSKSVFL